LDVPCSENSKSEARNTKQIQISKFKSKTKNEITAPNSKKWPKQQAPNSKQALLKLFHRLRAAGALSI
jgi:hypothetical protein